MQVLVIDNYDSFTYNLVQYVGEADESAKMTVKRNDEITLDEVRQRDPDAVIISPGPGTPDDAGISRDVIADLGPGTPVLGVCLGHQCIAEVYGGRIRSADRLLHGKTSEITHEDLPIYKHLPNPFPATRYHSLIVDEAGLPEELIVDAVSEYDEIMGIHHRNHPVIGVQFHPESILTENGRELMKNFLNYASKPTKLGEQPRPRPLNAEANHEVP